MGPEQGNCYKINIKSTKEIKSPSKEMDIGENVFESSYILHSRALGK